MIRDLKWPTGLRPDWKRLSASVLVALGVLACKSAQPSRAIPEVAVSNSRGAESHFQSLSAAWHERGEQGRGELETSFRSFLKLYPNDGAAARARVYLAWILARKGKLLEAQRLNEAARRGRLGTTRDFATVVEASLLIGHARPQEALKALRALQGKIIDPVERFLATQELVTATMAARLYAECLLYMVDWVEQAPAEREEDVRAGIRSRLYSMPVRVLRRALEDYAQTRKDARESRIQTRGELENEWLFEQVTERLVSVALDSGDAELAEQVIEQSPELNPSDSSEELARLASGGRPEPRVRQDTLGFVLRTADRNAIRRSTQVVAGLSFQLGSDIELLSAEDDGGMGAVEEAFAELAAQGASLIVAGVDEPSAAAAARAAQRLKLPTLLLSEQVTIDGEYFLGIGSSEFTQMTFVERALVARQLVPYRVIDSSEAHCPVSEVGSWRQEGIATIALLRADDCAERILVACRESRRCPALTFGLFAAPLRATLSPDWQLRAGGFPWDGTGPQAEPQRANWRARIGRPPSWFEALGRDAGVLSQKALRDAEVITSSDAGVVAATHNRLVQVLASSHTSDLWTSQEGRFDESLRLIRQLTLESRDEAESHPPSARTPGHGFPKGTNPIEKLNIAKHLN